MQRAVLAAATAWDGQGRLFNGDELLYLMVCERLDRGEAVPGAVGTFDAGGILATEALGVPTKFIPHAKPDVILASFGLDAAGITTAARQLLA